MQNIKISAITIIIITTVLVSHLYGMEYNLYIKYWFYDIILHFLGGAGIAISIYNIAIIFKIELIKNRLWSVVLLSFIGGMAWELFEIIFNLTGSRLWTTPYYIDTIKDLVNDTIGAMTVFLLIKNK